MAGNVIFNLMRASVKKHSGMYLTPESDEPDRFSGLAVCMCVCVVGDPLPSDLAEPIRLTPQGESPKEQVVEVTQKLSSRCFSCLLPSNFGAEKQPTLAGNLSMLGCRSPSYHGMLAGLALGFLVRISYPYPSPGFIYDGYHLFVGQYRLSLYCSVEQDGFLEQELFPCHRVVGCWLPIKVTCFDLLMRCHQILLQIRAPTVRHRLWVREIIPASRCCRNLIQRVMTCNGAKNSFSLELNTFVV